MKNLKMNRMIMLSALLSIVLIIQTGCTFGFTGIRGNGNVVKQDRNLSPFNRLEVGGAFRVYLIQGDKEMVTVEADENLMDVIKTEVKGNTLHIRTTEDIRDSKALNLYITFKELKGMDISGACKLSAEDKLKFDDLELDISGASDFELKLIAQNLDLDFSGASDVTLYGNAESVKLDLSGASKLDASEMETGTYEADVSGASSGKIFVTGDLSADVSGAASLKYKGDPKISSFDVSGAGSMKKY